MVEISCALFGPLRSFGAQQLQLSAGATVSDAKRALAEKLPQVRELIAASAFGTDHEVLTDSAAIEHGGNYVVLPPVSGG